MNINRKYTGLGHTPSSMAWLILKRGSLQGQIDRLEKQVRETPQKLKVLRVEIAALDIVIPMHEVVVDPAAIKSRRARGKATLPYGVMSRAIYECQRLAARLAGYKPVNKTVHDLQLNAGESKTLDPMGGGGGLPWDDPRARISLIIEKMNSIFSGKYSDAKFEGWATSVIGNASANAALTEQATANSTAG